jgi:hypothetical protein
MARISGSAQTALVCEALRRDLDRRNRLTGVRDAYFLLLIRERPISEGGAAHKGFSPEGAVGTPRPAAGA